MAGRVDPKLLEKPPIFSGQIRDWRVWRVRISAWLCGVDEIFDKLLKEAEQAKLPILTVDESVKHLDRFLFIELVGLVQGEHLDLILEAKHGFEAWRRMCGEFEQLTAGRKLLAIEDLLHPEFGDETMWRQRWLTWERQVDLCSGQTGLSLPDDVRIAIVRRRAPPALRQHLQLTANL